MASQLQQKLAAFRNNQMKLQTRAVEDAKRKQAAAERKAQQVSKPRPATAKAAKPLGKRQTAAIGKRLKDVLEWLKSEREPRSAADVLAATDVDVEGDSHMADAVKGNAKINITSAGLYQYKTLHEIGDADALLTALEAAGEKGLAQGDVVDSYRGIEEDLARLKQQRKLYAVYHADLRDEVLYSRDAKLDKVASYTPELAAVWRMVEAPSEPAELEAALHKAGIAPQPRTAEGKRTALSKERKKRKARAIDVNRATNAHMPELFQGEAPSNIDER